MKKIYIIIIGILFFWGCKPEIEEFTPDRGTLDLSRYVALGCSNTAGFANGDQYRDAQVFSFVNILATQFKEAGGGAFKQPLMVDELGFGTKRVLGAKIDCLGEASIAPVSASGTPDPDNQVNIGGAGPYQNMGVPGVKSFLMLPVPGPLPGVYSHPQFGNPYYARFAANPGVSTIIEEAAGQLPTFYSLWVGMYDVLHYAISGGTSDSITDPAIFGFALDNIIQTMAATGAKGVIGNIPDITDMPFFTTMSQNVPYNGMVLTAEQAGALNGVYDIFEAILGFDAFDWTFVEGPNPFIVQDNDIALPAPFNVRQMTADDKFLLTLPTDSLLCYGMGIPVESNPALGPNGIPSAYYLSGDQLTNISNTIDAYNLTIANLAAQYGLALVDVYGYIDDLKMGMKYEGISFSNVFVTGGFYSLDGLQLSFRGNALMANLFIEQINATYGSSIPKAVIGEYPGIIFP